jgi:hypothetical protein
MGWRVKWFPLWLWCAVFLVVLTLPALAADPPAPTIPLEDIPKRITKLEEDVTKALEAFQVAVEALKPRGRIDRIHPMPGFVRSPHERENHRSYAKGQAGGLSPSFPSCWGCPDSVDIDWEWRRNRHQHMTITTEPKPQRQSLLVPKLLEQISKAEGRELIPKLKPGAISF